MSQEFVKQLFNHRRIVAECAADLRHLAKSFVHVGNDAVAVRLCDVAGDIEASVDALTHEHGESLSAQINADHKAFRDTILAALAAQLKRKFPPGASLDHQGQEHRS